jgi:phosphate-selective porin OprO/OprP
MKKLYLATLVSALSVSAFAAPAPADLSSDTVVSTKGGFEIKNDLFSAKIGGRIHFDGRYVNEEDDLKATDRTNSNTSFRRARLSMEGKAYGWGYKFENDFAGQSGTTGSGFREMWIGTDFMGHNVRLGQAKPYRSMEELTSSNEITFMERPFSSASGLYNNRQFQQGVFIDAADKINDMAYGYGVAAYNTRSAAGSDTQGMGYNARGFVAPLNADGQVLHIGVSGSVDRNPLNNGTAASGTVAAVAPAPSNNFATSATIVRGATLSRAMTASSIQQDAYGVEVAYAMGPFSAQMEYATADHDFAGTTPSQKVETGYVQASFFVTDHARKYDAKKGVFKSPSVNSGAGAIELKARYDMMKNKDLAAKPEATQYMVGANYYINPNTRVMFEYVDGTATNANVDTDASAIQTRLQFSF